VNVEVRGRGSPVVLFHGWGMNLRVFDELAESLAIDHEVHAVDLPGHGRSAFDESAPAFEQQVSAIATGLPRRAVLLGWSLGGQFAIALANRLHARGLVLVASTPKFVNGAGWTAGVSVDLIETFARQLELDWQRTLDEFLQLQVRGSAESRRVLESLRGSLSRHGEPGTAALLAGLRCLHDNDLREAVGTLDLPALVINGQHDRVTPPAAAQWLTTNLPDARLVEIARAGHAPFLSHASAVASQVKSFLASLA
jgi:pimeloyl-[acyl-carrier protein] methyl ester esterase